MSDSAESERWQRKRRNREKAVREIVSTEQTYIQHLNYIINEYQTPLMQGRPRLITNEQVNILCPQIIRNILGLNMKFLADFESKVLQNYNNESTPLAYLFKEFVPFFKMYTNYVNNHEKAVTELRHLQDNEKFQKYCKEKMSICDGLDLSSLLITPIQRLPRYEMLINEVLKNTHESHPDREELQSAYEELKIMNNKVNKSMDEHNRREAVRIVEEQLGGSAQIGFSLVGPARRLVKKGKFHKMSRQKNIEYTFFLFSDMLLYCSDKGNENYRLHKKLPVNDAFSIQDVSEAECPNGFILYNSVKSFKAFASGPEEKKEWYDALNKVVTDYRIRRPQLPSRPGEGKELVAAIWDADGKQCVLCSKKFSLLTRRHHCRRCGKLVCHDCSKWRLPSLTKKTTVYERACKLCFQEYKDKGEESTKRHKIADGDGAESVMLGSQTGGSEANPEESLPSDLSSCERCRAMYDYDAEYGGDLSFKEGDTIIIIEQKGDWWKGLHEDKSKSQTPGLFPSNYVDIIQGPKSGDIYVAICNYMAESEEELTLRQGERYVLNVIDGSGWWLVSSEANPHERGWTSPQLVQKASEYEAGKPESSIPPSPSNSTSNISEPLHEPEPKEPSTTSIDPRLQSLSTQPQTSPSQKRQSGLPRPSMKQKITKTAVAPPQPKIEKKPSNSNSKSKKFNLGATALKKQAETPPPGPPPPPAPAIVAKKSSHKEVAKPAPVVAPLEDIGGCAEEDSGKTYFSYSELLEFRAQYKAQKISAYPHGIDKSKLQDYLVDEEFEEVMGMSRAAYEGLKGWKQTKVKQKAKLW